MINANYVNIIKVTSVTIIQVAKDFKSMYTVVPPLKAVSYCGTPCGLPQHSVAHHLIVSHFSC